MENTEIKTIEPETELNQSGNLFSNKDLFEHAQRVAMMLSKSELVPKDFKDKPANCVIALELANRIGASPLMVMQSLYIVHGKPGWSSTFLIATINACGKFSPMRYKETPTSCIAWAYDKKTNEILESIEVTMAMADAEGWINKAGSKWKTMPQLMRRYRAATFFARQFAPEISMGIYTKEEIEDISYEEIKHNKIDKEDERMNLLIDDCKSIADVEALQQQAPDYDIEKFEAKKQQLKNKK